MSSVCTHRLWSGNISCAWILKDNWKKNIWKKGFIGHALVPAELRPKLAGFGKPAAQRGLCTTSEFMLWLYMERESGDGREVEKNKNNQGKKRKMRPGHSTVLPCWGAVRLLCVWNQEQMRSCDGSFALTAGFVSIYWCALPAQLCQLYLHFQEQYLFPCAAWALCVFHGSLYPMSAFKLQLQFLI